MAPVQAPHASQPPEAPRPRAGWRLDLLILATGLAILALTVAVSLHFGANPGDLVTRNTMRLCFATYILAIVGMLRLRDADREARTPAGRAVRWTWTLANLYFLAHVAAAFHFYHHWSHHDAFERTRAISGLGEGLYVSYLFTLIWTADAAWWQFAPRTYAQRSRWITRCLHGFMAFIIFNGTVIYESGPIRVAGTIAFAAVLALWVSRLLTTRKGKLREIPSRNGNLNAPVTVVRSRDS